MILTEGDAKIGFGHVTRCLSVYQALIKRNVDTKMIVRGDQSVLSILKSINVEIQNWISDNDLSFFKTDLDLLIIDSTIADVDYLIGLFKHAKLTVYIDDSRRIQINKENTVIVDWTPFVEKEYQTINSQTTYLLGTKFIALREAFWNVGKKAINEKVSKLLITFGGNDLRNLNTVVLDLLLEKKYEDIHKKVIVGKGVNDLTQYEKYKNLQNVTFVFSPDERQMLDSFEEADVVISGGGQTLYELARVGVPTISIMIIDNQETDIKGWHDCGFIEYAGNWDKPDTFTKMLWYLDGFIADKSLRQSKSEKGQSIVDGQGTLRIIDFLIEKVEAL